MPRPLSLMLGVALVVGPGAATAQVVVGSELVGGSLRPTTGDPVSLFAVLPELRFFNPRYDFAIIGTGSMAPGSAVAPGGRLEAGLRQPVGGLWRADAAATLTHQRSLLGPVRTAVEGSFRLSRRVGGGGAWLSWSDRSGDVTGPWLAPNLARGFSGGVWRALGSIELRGSLSGIDVRRDGWITSVIPGRDSTAIIDTLPQDSVFRRRFSRYMAGELGLTWNPGPVRLAASGGATFSRAPGTPPLWYRVSGEVGLVPRVSLIVGAARLPVQVDPIAPHGRLLFGLRYGGQVGRRVAVNEPVRPTAMAFDVTTLQGEWRRFRVRAPAARSVRLMADFTDWAPVDMAPRDGGWWEAAIPVGPGSYRLNVQLDRERPEVPPGLPAVADEFQGRVGLLVLE
jgi:predicted carbohydrate-binding protein with CBM48